MVNNWGYVVASNKCKRVVNMDILRDQINSHEGPNLCSVTFLWHGSLVFAAR